MQKSAVFSQTNYPLYKSIPKARFDLSEDRVLLNGTQAAVRLMLEQSASDHASELNTGGYVSGYRGSPVAGIDLEIERNQQQLSNANIQFQPGINEELAATAVWGAQQVSLHDNRNTQGVFGLWYGKGPGVDRTGDVFKHGNFTGTAEYGGVIALAGDDADAKSSTWPNQSDYAFIDAEMPILAPASIGDTIELGLHGYALSRYSSLWVGMTGPTDVLDLVSSVNLSKHRPEILLPQGPLPRSLAELHRPTKLAYRVEAEQLMRELKLPAAQAYARSNQLNRITLEPKNPRVALVASGHAYAVLQDCLVALGLDRQWLSDHGVRLCQVRMPWPMDSATSRSFAKGVEKLLVVEHKRAVLEPQLTAHIYPLEQRPQLFGKAHPSGEQLLSETGQLDSLQIARALKAVLPTALWPERAEAVLHQWIHNAPSRAKLTQNRTPYFCSGCPHNSGTQTSNDERSMAGVGCHVLAETMDRTTDGYTQMGGEGVPWLGMAAFCPGEHMIANLGDGTFYHSGSLAIRAAVAARVPITFRLLYNGVTAMTGGQGPDGPLTVERTIELIAAEGVTDIALLSDEVEVWQKKQLPGGVGVHDRSELEAVQAAMRERGGVSVIVFTQACATELRRKRKRGLHPKAPRKLWINPRVCEGCGDCSVQSNCLSVEKISTEFGTKRRINPSTCNDDLRCADGFCPSFVAIDGAELDRVEHPPIPTIELPVPAVASSEHGWQAAFFGVGGNGIITSATLLASAAHIQGLAAQSLGMAGLAQKGGPVVAQLRIGKQAAVAKLNIGSADLALAADLVVANAPSNLPLYSRDCTHLLANLGVTPTAAELMQSTQGLSAQQLHQQAAEHCQASTGIQAKRLAERYLGDSVYANTILLGAAAQAGLLPVSVESLQQAIADNGARTKQNLDALALGRVAVYAPSQVEDNTTTPAVDESPQQLVDRFANHLRDYQSANYSQRYRQLMGPLMELTDHDELVHTAGPLLYRLMAYKDEYEVARLHSLPQARADREATLGKQGKVSLYLAPPLPWQQAGSTPKKRRFGSWIFPVLRLLQHGKRLRGSCLDVFGYSNERKAERQLIETYAQSITLAAEAAAAGRTTWADRLLHWPSGIKGYGHIKAARIEQAEQRRAWLIQGHTVQRYSPPQKPSMDTQEKASA